KTVTVTRASTETNTSIADLISDINTALTAAALNGQVQAVADGNRVVLQGVGAVASIHLTTTTGNAAVKDLGFTSAQDSVNEGGTQKIKATKDLPALTGRLSADAAFQVSMNTVGSSPVAVTVAKGLTQANRYLFDIVNDVQDAIDAVAALHGKIKVGFLANR